MPENGSLECHRIRTRLYLAGGHDFDRVGAFVLNFIQEEHKFTVQRAEILGKGCIMENTTANISYIVAIPTEVLNER
jgi:hypothetical protein